jgi:hypothetical protein
MRWSLTLLGIATFLLPAASARAQSDILQVIPDDAIGFAVVNRIGQTNEKFGAVAKRLKLPLPGNPLEMVKDALGVDKGLAEKGSVAVAAFESKGENEEPRALIFVPVTEYQTFIDQLQPGETKDGITPLTLRNGKPMLAGKRGNFAILTLPADRALLERGLKADKSLATWAEPLQAWLTENDAAGVLTGRGIRLVGAKASHGIDEAKQNLGNLPQEVGQVFGKALDGFDSFFKSAASDLTHAGLGARIDSAGNVHVTARAQFLKDSGFAKAGASVKAPPEALLAGLPAGPFVMAAAVALPEKLKQRLVSMNVELMKSGAQNIPEESLKKLEKAYSQTMKGISGMNFVWQVGKEKQSMFAGMAATMRADNAAAYFAEYEKGMAAMNEVVKELNLPVSPAYEVKKVKVDGKQVLEMSMDFGAAFGGIPEEMQKIFKGMFGPDGKMTIALAARDDKTVVMRYTGAGGLKDMLSGQTKELGKDAGVAQVIQALPVGSQWAVFLSPKGLTDFADRMVKSFSPIQLQVPQFPATPPVAAAVRVSAERFELHVVIPAGVVDNVGEFVNQLKALFGGGV